MSTSLTISISKPDPSLFGILSSLLWTLKNGSGKTTWKNVQRLENLLRLFALLVEDLYLDKGLALSPDWKALRDTSSVRETATRDVITSRIGIANFLRRMYATSSTEYGALGKELRRVRSEGTRG
jgi:hypothetical protein